MPLFKKSFENLLDLVEIKAGALQIVNHEDQRELKHLETCRSELLVIQDEMKSSRRHGLPNFLNVTHY